MPKMGLNVIQLNQFFLKATGKYRESAPTPWIHIYIIQMKGGGQTLSFPLVGSPQTKEFRDMTFKSGGVNGERTLNLS